MMLANDNEEPRAHLERAGGSADGTLGQPEGTGAHTAEDSLTSEKPGDHRPPSSSSSMSACDLDIMEGGGIGGEEKGNGGWGSAVVSPAAPDQSSCMHFGPVVDDPSIPSNTNNESISTSDLRVSFMDTGGEGAGGGRYASDGTPDANDSAVSAQAIPSLTPDPSRDKGAKLAAEETDWCKLLLISVGLLILFLAVAEGSPRLMCSVFPDSFSLSKLRKVCYGAAGTMSTVVIGGLVVRKYISSAAAQRLRQCFGWIAPISALI